MFNDLTLTKTIKIGDSEISISATSYADFDDCLLDALKCSLDAFEAEFNSNMAKTKRSESSASKQRRA